MAVKIPLTVKKNIKDATANNEGYLKEINTLLGTQWTLDIDYPQIYETVLANDHDKEWAERFGTFITSYLDSFAHNVKTFVGKDEDYKDALVDEVTAKKIVFKLIDTKEFDYCKATVEDGALVFNVKKGGFATNIDNMGQNLENEL